METLEGGLMGFVKKSNAQVFLLINAILWGSSYVWSKMLLGYLPRFSILAICSFGSLITILIFFFPAIKALSKGTIFLSIGISSFAVLSNTFCMLALQHTSSSNASFIIQTSVIMTPLIMMVVDRKFPGFKFIIGAITAIVGIFMLTSDFSSFSLHTGDLFALGAALFFSIRLAALNKFSKKLDAVQYTFVHHSFNLFVFMILALTFEVGSINFYGLASPVFAAAIFASIFVAVSTELIQSKALKFVKPERATLIYTLEPLTTVMLAFVLIGENFSGLGQIAGSVLILASVIISIASGRKKVTVPAAQFYFCVNGKNFTSSANKCPIITSSTKKEKNAEGFSTPMINSSFKDRAFRVRSL